MRKDKRKRKSSIEKMDKEISVEFLKSLKIDNILFETNFERDSERLRKVREYIC